MRNKTVLQPERDAAAHGGIQLLAGKAPESEDPKPEAKRGSGSRLATVTLCLY